MKQLKPYIFPGVTALSVILIYAVFPLVLSDHSLTKALYFATRLILLMYLAITLYLLFKEKMGFKADMQKLFYQGTIHSLLFSLYIVAGFLVAFAINPPNQEEYSVFSAGLGLFVKFLKNGMLYVVPILALIYFHPLNANKRRKKKK